MTLEPQDGGAEVDSGLYPINFFAPDGSVQEYDLPPLREFSSHDLTGLNTLSEIFCFLMGLNVFVLFIELIDFKKLDIILYPFYPFFTLFTLFF